MKKYINMKNNYGIETIEEINDNEFKSFKEYRKEYNRLLHEYQLSDSYNSYYLSTRCTNDYKNK